MLPSVAPLDTETRARARFYLRYKQQFAALLPEGSQFFVGLQRLAGDTGHIVPKEAIQEQPSLITGGTMKDYQVGLNYGYLSQVIKLLLLKSIAGGSLASRVAASELRERHPRRRVSIFSPKFTAMSSHKYAEWASAKLFRYAGA